ncbi:MAG: hypothetical protein ACE5H4_16080 [Candidatus Thorarchaeota archaeon]
MSRDRSRVRLMLLLSLFFISSLAALLSPTLIILRVRSAVANDIGEWQEREYETVLSEEDPVFSATSIIEPANEFRIKELHTNGTPVTILAETWSGTGSDPVVTVVMLNNVTTIENVTVLFRLEPDLLEQKLTISRQNEDVLLQLKYEYSNRRRIFGLVFVPPWELIPFALAPLALYFASGLVSAHKKSSLAVLVCVLFGGAILMAQWTVGHTAGEYQLVQREEITDVRSFTYSVNATTPTAVLDFSDWVVDTGYQIRISSLNTSGNPVHLEISLRGRLS